MHYMEKDIQLWLQNYKPKLVAFRPSKIEQGMNLFNQTGHCDAT